MAGIVRDRPSKHGRITDPGLSNGVKAKSLPSVAVFAYDWCRIEGYLGNTRWKVGKWTLQRF